MEGKHSSPMALLCVVGSPLPFNIYIKPLGKLIHWYGLTNILITPIKYLYDSESSAACEGLNGKEQFMAQLSQD